MFLYLLLKVKSIISRRADVTVSDDDGATALHVVRLFEYCFMSIHNHFCPFLCINHLSDLKALALILLVHIRCINNSIFIASIFSRCL